MTKEKKSSHKLAAEVGAGVAATAAVTAVGLYFFTGPKGVKNRKKAKEWVSKAKNEVAKNFKKIKHIDEKTYKHAVDEAVKAYRSLNINKKDLDQMAKELKSHWGNIKKEVGKTQKSVLKPIKAKIKAKTNSKSSRKR
ncbi:MAG: hypothetical protein COU46_03350 [Candidatus Niyogibacteria bacterium CG10_big_fil_rev_8_21_14_0_10_42_19]|uniref:YtxH domain-containing protein n=1 Tax=Candidatus Niyogibacteria bacterium CG10_big_fil_rev_8_21_14_0_10_42_19 TaxID=1974725 RepID=A0A2H0TEV8_9BACT|nr:MAG: hypothetical protein COU46_03350 [Candidatus Niyogibacteria bacterium CG10_big_fil_rev_8_21_14_0_10_42_19]